MLEWTGELRFGDFFAVYHGPAGDNDLHQHAAYQLIVAASGHANVVDEDGKVFAAKALMIHPLVPHAISAKTPLSMVYIDPQSPLAFDLTDRTESSGIVEICDDMLPFEQDADPTSIFASLQAAGKYPASQLDPRLASALDILGARPGQVAIADAAAQCYLSESRLRTLSREQLLVPMSTWIIWRKLESAARELSSGVSLSEAALAGGFADQAHFTREMRRMFGITPRSAAATLNPKQ